MVAGYSEPDLRTLSATAIARLSLTPRHSSAHGHGCEPGDPRPLTIERPFNHAGRTSQHVRAEWGKIAAEPGIAGTLVVPGPRKPSRSSEG